MSPARIGRYEIAAELDSRAGGIRRFVAHGDDGRPAVVLSPTSEVATDSGYRTRFWTEANNSRKLSSPWIAPVKDCSPRDATVPWVAYGCFPAIALSAVVAQHGLDESSVCALGLALAEALVSAHANGLVFAGVSPDAVLLTPQGPRLTGYGLVRAASADGFVRADVPGVETGFLAPEQRAGGRPRPLGDIFAMAAVLSFAATGSSSPGIEKLRGSLRPLLTDCLAEDPASRPQAHKVVERLSQFGGHPAGTLTEAVAMALDTQATEYGQVPSTRGSTIQSPETTDDHRTSEAGPSGRTPSRRALIAGLAYGAGGLAAGSGGVFGWRQWSTKKQGDDRAIPGVSPAPLWSYAHDGREIDAVTLVGSRVAMISASSGVGLSALDLTKGKRLWSREDILPTEEPIPVGSGDVLVPEFDKLSLVSARSSRIAWRESSYAPSAPYTWETFLCAKGNTIWFLARSLSPQSDADQFAAVAYDVKRRKELWRRTIPAAFANPITGSSQVGPSVTGGMLLLPNTGVQANGEHHTYLALDAGTGKELWRTTFKQVARDPFAPVFPLAGRLLLAGSDDALLGLNLESGRARWRMPVRGFASHHSAFHGDVLYVVDSQQATHAVDIRTGKRRWQRERMDSSSMAAEVKAMSLSASKGVLFVSSTTEIDALDVRDGSPLWRLATVGNGSQSGTPGQMVASIMGMMLVSGGNTLYALPVD